MEDNLQIRRVDVNILNEQSWTVSKGFCPAWVLGEGLAYSYSRLGQVVGFGEHGHKSVVL